MGEKPERLSKGAQALLIAKQFDHSLVAGQHLPPGSTKLSPMVCDKESDCVSSWEKPARSGGPLFQERLVRDGRYFYFGEEERLHYRVQWRGGEELRL